MGVSRDNTSPSAIVTGASAGLGLHVCRRLLRENYRLTMLGRNADRLRDAERSLREEFPRSEVKAFAGDACDADSMNRMVAEHVQRFESLDALVNVVGRSDRGLLIHSSAEELESLFRDNVISAWTCSRAVHESLQQTRGAIVNLGSLASRVAPRYLGGYVIAKHALVGFSRQLRMELESDGIHVGVVCPGPIRRDDDLPIDRYQTDTKTGVPATAAQPGGGAKLKGLPPEQVADAVLKCIMQRKIEIVMPGKVRALMAVNAISPKLADWLLAKSTA
ncbi:SDR family NAD(P)-dependent oxidoreductase [Rhodopirellula halodulae]|uniref:SDR family NAD(P)-dependent oxidoreductase n=1 Tax=Rhodopirellula halodulae TaxID=2894198 RepID=UPI001E63147D|nr:SDR family oxidoreductase [Rhodopirellula sp. JC737]MCC9655641.1 SDR family oxidoreductase [Rhodopirellula sp. JC737]